MSDGYTQLVVDDRVPAAKRTIDFSAPGFATVDGDRIVVPLSFLSTDFQRTSAGP